MKKKLMTNSLRETLWGWLFVSLWVVGFLVFTCYPLGRTFALSFNKVTITAEGIVTEAVGGANYKNALLSDVVFTDALIDFVGELILDVPIVIVFSLVMAMILNMGLKGTGLLRTVFFLPVIIMSGPVMKKLIENGATTIQGAAESALVQNVLSMLPEQLASILNNLLSSFIMILWFCGVQILIFLSALQKVDKPVYEAAKIDGASRFRRVLSVDLPAIMPTVCILLILRFGSIMSVGHEKVLMMQYGTNMMKSEIISTYVYNSTLSNPDNWSYGSAIGLMNSVINTSLVLLVNWITNKLSDGESGLF